MRDELLKEIFLIVDKALCPQIGIPLVDGRVELALKPQILQVLNRLQNEGKEDEPSGGGYDDVILTETERLKLAQFFRTVGKLPILCVHQRSVHSSENHIDLRGFKKLTSLKLVRINLKKLKWISDLKSQLSSLKCAHSIETDTIFCDTLAWAELVTLSVNFCDIHPTDNSHYFRNAPWVRKLDLSHCKLRKCDFLMHLEHLEHLNLSFNFIGEIPKLNARCRLRTLLMSFNNVSALDGLKYTPTVTELDLSDNWIPDKYSLDPLKYLVQLRSVKLKGSPVSLIKFYRIYVASCLCSEVEKSQISVDGVGLSRTERSVLCMKLFERKPAPDRPEANASAHVDVNLPSTSRGFVEETPGLSVITGIEYKGEVYPVSTSGKNRKTVRVPIIWDDSLDQNGSPPPVKEETPKGVAMGPSIFPKMPLPTAEQNLNEELMALREALIRSQPVAGSLKSLEENRMISTVLSPDSLNIQLGGITLPSPKIYGDDSPKSEIVPATVFVQVHATEAQGQSDVDERPCSSREGASTSRDIEVDLPENDDIPEQSGNDPETDLDPGPEENVEKTSDSVAISLVPTSTAEPEPNKAIKKLEDYSSDSGVCSDHQELVSSTECESSTETSVLALQQVDKAVERVQGLDEVNEDEETSASTTAAAVDEEVVAPSEAERLHVTRPENGVIENEPDPESAVADDSSPKDSDEESYYESDADADELLWQVLRIDSSNKSCQTVFLALLETELKERSPKSGETLTKWPLDSVLSCVKTKNDPITIEMEFDSERKDRQHRVYVMEYADAKTLTKKIYSVLESRPLSAMNQVSLKCLKCGSMFAHMKPSNNKTKEDAPACPICGNSSVVEAEEPKLPENLPAPKPLSHAASHSSIGSAASMEQSQKSGSQHNRRYESDIEVISNPSQSSIEVIDESSRSQSVTPRRRMSDERQPASNSESVVREAAPLSTLTESSSSGSLTESVITAYESHSVVINRKSMSAVSLPEEGGENSPDNSAFNSTAGTLEEENGNLALPKSSQDVYSFTDFVDVDLRVKTFIYHSIFKNENEELRALVRCHIWKTGGTDYDGCFVLSSSASYFLFHTRTDFSEQICDWLSLNETFPLGDIKRVQPIIWYQGLEIQIKNFSFLLLVMDQEKTQNVVKHFSGLSLKGVKILPKPNTKIELSLQQAVLTSDLSHTSDDPTVTYMLVCKSVEIAKGDESEEILRLAGLVITAGLFLLIPGDLSWLCSAIPPSIVSSRDLPSLIEVAKKGTDVVLRFFDEAEATEEKWKIRLGATGQIGPLVDAIRRPWERKFSVPLEVTGL